MRCSGCAAENAPDCRFCSECGARLVSICPSCRFENAPAAKFCGGCGARLTGAAAPAVTQPAPESYTPKPLAERILRSRGALEGERKQVTVLFADIKGSMELIQGADPEDARHILDPTIEAMMRAVHRYEGTVNKVLGDGIMALFGAPIAHEDHAVRACYAALAMQNGLREPGAGLIRSGRSGCQWRPAQKMRARQEGEMRNFARANRTGFLAASGFSVGSNQRVGARLRANQAAQRRSRVRSSGKPIVL